MNTGTAPRIDIGALAGALYNEAATRIAETVVEVIDWLDDDGNGLNQKQRTALVRTALISTEGLEAHFALSLKTTLAIEGVRTWGLSDHLERLLGGTA